MVGAANIDENLESGEGLYLCGATGTGKTHLAAALLTEILTTKQLGGFFITAEKFIAATYDELRSDG